MPQLENICKFVKGFSFKNTKNTENSAIRKQTTHQKKKNGQKIWTDTSPRKTANKYLQRCSSSFVIGEVHETTVRYHTHLSEWLKRRTLATRNAGELATQQLLSLVLAGDANGTGSLAKILAISSKVKHSLTIPHHTYNYHNIQFSNLIFF